MRAKHCRALPSPKFRRAYFLPVLVCDKALPAMLLEVLEDLGFESTLDALLATDLLVCFVLAIVSPAFHVCDTNSIPHIEADVKRYTIFCII
jgi:hypothetical protein